MAVALAASYPVFSAASNITAVTTPSFTPATGEVIVLKGSTENSLTTLASATATGGGITWTKRSEGASTNQCYTVIWTGIVTAGGSAITVSIAPTSTCFHGMVVERWTGAQLAATPATSTMVGTTGTASFTLTTVAANSVISWLDGDFNAVATGTPTYITSSATPTIEDARQVTAGSYSAYSAYQAAVTPGSKAYGVATPTGQSWSVNAIEIQASAAAVAQPSRLMMMGVGA